MSAGWNTRFAIFTNFPYGSLSQTRRQRLSPVCPGDVNEELTSFRWCTSRSCDQGKHPSAPRNSRSWSPPEKEQPYVAKSRGRILMNTPPALLRYVRFRSHSHAVRAAFMARLRDTRAKSTPNTSLIVVSPPKTKRPNNAGSATSPNSNDRANPPVSNAIVSRRMRVGFSLRNQR
jgi:hypothetical protein